jgi:hypothetical protein
MHTIKVDGLSRPTTDSRGRRIASTVDGLTSFWRYFGKSRAVDAAGRPLQAYHGTQDSFDAFDPTTQGRNVSQGDVGFFFTNYAQEANAYAFWDSARDDRQPNVMPVYLKLENPKLIDLADVGYDSPGAWYDAEGGAAAREALEQGYDGLIVSDSDDITNMPDGTKLTMYVVYEPNQIKSAIGNRGVFDPSDPSITDGRGLAPALDRKVTEAANTDTQRSRLRPR